MRRLGQIWIFHSSSVMQQRTVTSEEDENDEK